MTATHVAVFSAKPYDQAYLMDLADEQFYLCFYDLPLNPLTASLAKDALIVSAFVNDDLSADTLKTLAENGTQLIALRCAGFNHVDLVAARYFGITVVNVPAYSPYAVAEHTIALMLALSRKIPRAYHRVRDGNFSLDGLLGFDFFGKTAGIIGGGKIGLLVAERLRAFGCRIVVYEPYQPEKVSDAGFKVVPLEHLLEQSDIVSLHCPLNESTRHIVNADSLRQLKPGAMLINTSRGALLDTTAVLDALKSLRLGYLGIDVYEQEGSLFFEDHSSDIIQDDVFQRLLTFPNVLVTGHQAYFTREALTHIAQTTLQNMADFVAGNALKNQVGND